ncbi:Nucleoside-diphosphate-sugar epimerase [Saccharopolyspora antimicrobica]|uniref:Nucleoside-diphosphate-sugar epimerase n=1 Tax=Saccharopolyspora antimicrobica TaxID=455193 RepID=A0A1I4VU65_9PSEU|nr:NAD-dependent epimerase/dehydratase family protein [Saccharopolyspora antimicrobica]RKT87208.1 nucleoside-diphosphate-sugar epimerase [Saccharopolyspora antimicrobica]SFN04723.1 Nucleoside-diphosphate-sugar epimerase [Saccharopolyspora antimicrobica]
MKVFITGASGYVGGVVAGHLLAAGHDVAALARSEQAAARVRRLGARVVRGDLTDLGVLRDSAAGADAVVHAAIDFAEPDMRKLEEPALAAMLDELDGGRSFVYASTALVYPDTAGGPPREDGDLDPASPQLFKRLGEQQVLAAGGVTATVLRGSLVYGHAGSALLLAMIGASKEHDAAPYVGRGTNQWSTIHVDDLARLYVTALEKQIGGVFNASSRVQVGVRELSEAVSQLVGAGARPLSPEQAAQSFGPLLPILDREITLDPARAEQAFGWKPQEVGLLEDLTTGSYRALAP